MIPSRAVIHTAPRFTHIVHPAGVLLVDQVTGAVCVVPADGASIRTLRAGVDEARIDAEILADTDTITRTYPRPIARTYSRALATREPALRCHHIVECFVTALKYWTLLLLEEYLATDLRDPTLDSALRNWRRPLTSAWGTALERALNVFAAARREPFAQGLRQAIEALGNLRVAREPRLRHPDEAAISESLGSVAPLEALVNLRNRMAHEPAPRGDRAGDLADRYLVVLRDVLRETRCVAEHPLFATRGDGTLLRLMGTTPETVSRDALPNATSLPAGVFLSTPDFGRTLPLEVSFELAARGAPPNADDLLLLESFDGDELVYHSVGGDVVHRRWKGHPWTLRLAARPPLRRCSALRATNSSLSRAPRRRGAWRAGGIAATGFPSSSSRPAPSARLNSSSARRAPRTGLRQARLFSSKAPAGAGVRRRSRGSRRVCALRRSWCSRRQRRFERSTGRSASSRSAVWDLVSPGVSPRCSRGSTRPWAPRRGWCCSSMTSAQTASARREAIVRLTESVEQCPWLRVVAACV